MLTAELHKAGFQGQAIGTVSVTHHNKPVSRHTPGFQLSAHAALKIALSIVRNTLKVAALLPSREQAGQ
ncbi:hypothetical protein ADT25_22590 [Xanthomonas oryzae]|uniref:Uncharacterized protein n=1 Tax=Xanthomonas oryzae TaxID=347 RepID=A0AAP0ZHD8_9XANT|nr:hypothetical protein ADT25_22590 [Xanthomonas oryzae]